MQAVSQPKTLLCLEVRVNSVDDVVYACLLQLKLDEVYTIPEIQLWRQQQPLHQARPASSRRLPQRQSPRHTKTVNEAWQAAGFEGTISPTLVNKTRVRLTGNLRGNSKTAAKEKSAPRHAQDSNRYSRQDQLLERVPQRPSRRQRQSRERGVDGSRIRRDHQQTLVYKARASLGLTGNLSGKTKEAAEGKATSTGKKLGRPRKEPTAPVTGQPRGRKSNRSLALNELEADIDRLIFKVMGVGDLTEIEDSLRQARRLLYGALTRG